MKPVVVSLEESGNFDRTGNYTKGGIRYDISFSASTSWNNDYFPFHQQIIGTFGARCKMIGIDESYVVSISQLDVQHDENHNGDGVFALICHCTKISVWTLPGREDAELTKATAAAGLRSSDKYKESSLPDSGSINKPCGSKYPLKHVWSKYISDLVNIGKLRLQQRQPPELTFVDYLFSRGTGKQILLLLSDCTVFIVDLVAKKSVFQVNLLLMLTNIHDEEDELVGGERRGIESNEGCITSIAQHPCYGFKHIVFALNNRCYAFNSLTSSSSTRTIDSDEPTPLTHANPILLITPGGDEQGRRGDKIHHISFSKNGKYLSCCTGPTSGTVLIYDAQPPMHQNSHSMSTTPLYTLLYTLNVGLNERDGPLVSPLHALSSDFSWTSEELLVSYSTGESRVWQFPRFMNLMDITRIAILSLVPEEAIEELQLPKKLKKYLRFLQP